MKNHFLKRYFLSPLSTLLLAVAVISFMPVAQAEDTPNTSSQVVNINTADAETLSALLKGVGEARAQRIIEYREQYGAFLSVEDLSKIKGIGESILNKNRERIVLK